MHTPGPWYVSGTHVYSHGAIRPSGAGRPRVADCSYDDRDVVSEQERNANRSLIAAAPDLLDALRIVVAQTDRDWIVGGKEVVEAGVNHVRQILHDAASAAIEKATA